MQLAASHRPHPPPVPPRPSRQVVAEALKRTPKLPCPTRQAPPPPNTKPWRPPSDNKIIKQSGRTLIYESSNNQQQSIKKNIERTIDLEKTQECRSTSERIENHRERQQEPAQQQPQFILNGNENFVFESNDQTDIINNKELINLSNEKLSIVNNINNDNNLIKKNNELINNNNPINLKIDNKLSIDLSKNKISSDDCATVVIIDETEHKITLNEDNKDNIQHQDWLEAGVRYSSTKITLPGDDTINTNQYDTDDEKFHFDHFDDNKNNERIKFNLDFSSIRERIAMSSLQGLPPLPRSLSGFNLSEGRRDSGEPPPPPTRSSSKTSKSGKTQQSTGSRPSPPSRQLTTLDTQLAILRKEMFGLRQLDLSLLSQLWSLNESIQEFRQLLQDQEDRAPSSSPSSEDGDDGGYHGHPPPPPRRPAPLLHHHRPPRPPRPLRPPPSDESPSSEEYGAV